MPSLRNNHVLVPVLLFVHLSEVQLLILFVWITKIDPLFIASYNSTNETGISWIFKQLFASFKTSLSLTCSQFMRHFSIAPIDLVKSVKMSYDWYLKYIEFGRQSLSTYWWIGLDCFTDVLFVLIITNIFINYKI